jgi:hypothetical protein
MSDLLLLKAQTLEKVAGGGLAAGPESITLPVLASAVEATCLNIDLKRRRWWI